MNGVSIGIIGGTGGMGSWLNRFFAEKGHTVSIAGRKTELTYTDLAGACEVVVLSTPVDAAMAICQDIGPKMGSGQLLMDVCSLKEAIMECMLSCTSAQVVGTHPLFGPSIDSIREQNVVICPGRGHRWLGWLENEFRSRGAVVTRSDAVSHDKYMGIVQGLTHFITICMGKTLQKMDISPHDVAPFATPIFKLKLDLIGRLFALDLGLYQNLIGKNRHTRSALDAFFSSMEDGRDHLLFGEKKDADRYLETIREFLGAFCREALEKSSAFLNTLYPE